MELKQTICKNPWCKVTFNYQGDVVPDQCYKCIGFENTSGGVTWTEKKYEGPRFDGQPHPISINIQKAGENKKLW
jgi:hypothetical protein